MALNVERPQFYEGQVLGAADLNAAVDYGRGARARHQRTQHRWGIVAGLELAGSDRTTGAGDPYQEVVVEAGLAVDGTGLAIAVLESIRLSESDFDQLNVAIADPEARYPVFLQGRDRESDSAAGLGGACETGQATRVAETSEVAFGRPGDELDLDDQQSVEIGDGPGGGTPGGGTWRILLGFVEWDPAIQRFTAVADEADGVGRRYAGVRAGEVEALGPKLVLRSAAAGEDGTAALELDSGTGGGGAEAGLRFGPQNSSGQVTPVLTVDTSGNLTVTGKIVGALAGGVQVESGVASDGMLLPLPAGITRSQVDDGEVVIQVHVTPRYQTPPDLDPAQKWLAHPVECRVVDRRVLCRCRWIRTDGVGGAAAGVEDRLGVCDYVLMAFPAGGS